MAKYIIIEMDKYHTAPSQYIEEPFNDFGLKLKGIKDFTNKAEAIKTANLLYTINKNKGVCYAVATEDFDFDKYKFNGEYFPIVSKNDCISFSDNWGGKRAGAGRPKSENPKILWSVKVTIEEREILKEKLAEIRK